MRELRKWTYLAIIYIFQMLWHLYEIWGVDGRLQKFNVEMQPERGCATASTVIFGDEARENSVEE